MLFVPNNNLFPKMSGQEPEHAIPIESDAPADKAKSPTDEAVSTKDHLHRHQFFKLHIRIVRKRRPYISDISSEEHLLEGVWSSCIRLGGTTRPCRQDRTACYAHLDRRRDRKLGRPNPRWHRTLDVAVSCLGSCFYVLNL
jgi:hypothetical protein